jgi:signal transduction histidine kinase
VPLALAGAAVVASLMLQSASFLVVAVPSVGSFFVALPVAWAALSALAVGSAVDVAVRRLGVEPHADGVLLAMAAVRILGIIAIGVIVKTVVTRAEERRRLFETLAAAERRAGVLEERSRLAREIHDTLAQGFVGISSQLDAVAMCMEEHESPARKHLDLARRMARHSLTEARRSVMDLRASVLEGQDLPAALQAGARMWTAGSGVEVDVDVSGAVIELPRDVEQHLLRIAQEAVANTLKHSGATRILIRLHVESRKLYLRIKDNGRGFDQEGAFASVGGHFGLIGMRERAERLGGELRLTSDAGEGTEVQVSVPLP